MQHGLIKTEEQLAEEFEESVVTTDDIEYHLEKTEVEYTKEEVVVLNSQAIILVVVGMGLLFCSCGVLMFYFIYRHKKLNQAIKKADHDVDVQMGDVPSLPKRSPDEPQARADPYRYSSAKQPAAKGLAYQEY